MRTILTGLMQPQAFPSVWGGDSLQETKLHFHSNQPAVWWLLGIVPAKSLDIFRDELQLFKSVYTISVRDRL